MASGRTSPQAAPKSRSVHFRRAGIEVDKPGTDLISEGTVPQELCILAHGQVDIILKNGACVDRAAAHAKERHNSYPFFVCRAGARTPDQPRASRLTYICWGSHAFVGPRISGQGEMGLLANKPAMAYVRAASPCKVLTVSRANFARFLSLVPGLLSRPVDRHLIPPA